MQKTIRRTVIVSIAVLMVFLFCFSGQAYDLPDTGQTDCFSAKVKGKVVTCPQPGNSLAQDGSYAIHPLSYTINGDGTVIDNNTKLIWQGEDDSIMRTWPEADNYCSNLNLGGYPDWRLPTKRELVGIVNYGQKNLAIDPSAFPNTKNSHYWSSTRMTCSEGEPWSVDFASGNYNLLLPATRAFTRCVRSSTLPFAHFVDNGDGTVSDLSTGLRWQQNEKNPVSWTDALKYCESLSLGGHADWRVPNIKEYESLTHGTEGPSIMSDYLNLNLNFPSWSSTTYLLMPDYFSKWTMNHNGLMGICSIKDKNCRKYGVRCVRSEQRPPLDEREIQAAPKQLTLWHANGAGVTTENVIISNSGSQDLLIGSISPPSPPFFLSEDTCSSATLTAYTSCWITVSFPVDATGQFTGNISIPSNDADKPVLIINIKGSAMDAFYLPDTGQDTCYSGGGSQITCPLPELPMAQDGSYEMNQPSYMQNNDGMVRDNNTTLTWQQQDDGVTRTWDEAASYCENLALGGHTDWRFPTIRELSGLADYGRHDPAIDGTVFPSTKNSPYWSSSSSDTYKDNAWHVNFSDGTVGGSAKSSRYYVRCARGAELPLDTLLDNADGTTTDLLSGVTWEQGDATAANWEAALARCEGLSLAGYTDWRLPNIRELTSLLDIRYKPAINHVFFPQVDCSYWSEYWSSTSSYIPDDAYVVDFFNGYSSSFFEHKFYNNYNVRCVRGGFRKSPAVLKGTVTDSTTDLPLPDVLVTVTDANATQTNTSDTLGLYTISGLSPGGFTASFEKAAYGGKIVNGTLSDGQTVTLDVCLTPVPPPYIAMLTPENGAVVNASPVEVAGTVSSDASVTVNGIAAMVQEGFFSVSIPIQIGQNTITALASDPYGRTASHSVTITLVTQGSISGLVKDSLNLLPVESALVSVTDSLDVNRTTLTGADGRFILEGVEAGYFALNITKEGFNLYTLTGTLGAGEDREVQATLSKTFTASTIGDYGNVTVMEVTGNYDAKNPDGSLNIVPRQEIAREFFRLHVDEYDFFVLFSNFSYAMPDPAAKGFYLEVKNDIQGIGKSLVDNTASFGSNGRLQGIIDMGNLVTLITDPRDQNFEDTINTLMHEQMHRWGANIKYRDAFGSLRTDLLGKDASHWSFLLDSGASVHYGNAWEDNGNGTFTSTGAEKYCSPLDLYLMGFIGKSLVPPMLLIENPSIDPARLPEPGSTISGTARYITIDDIISAEGDRLPDASNSQKVFRAAFILLTTPGSFTGTELQGIEDIRNAWAGRFSWLSGGQGKIADVAPSLTVTISSPSHGDIVSACGTVKGAVINSTGNDTGVTVNGIPTAIYGNQFVVNHVPFAEGINTLTATATDSAGNTASDSVTVTSFTEDNFIRLQTDIEAGIAPLNFVVSIEASFHFAEAEISVTGPSQPDVVDSVENEYRFSIAVEGLYTFTAEVTAPDGTIYHDSVVVRVMNSTQMDTLLRRKWHGMKDALKIRDFDTAADFFLDETRPHYHDIFSSLDEHMPQIVEEMQDIERIYIKGNAAKYRIRKDELYGGQTVPMTHYIYFLTDQDGLWKIDWY